MLTTIPRSVRGLAGKKATNLSAESAVQKFLTLLILRLGPRFGIWFYTDKLRKPSTSLSAEDGDQGSVEVPLSLIFMHGRPLCCHYHLDLFLRKFDSYSRQRYMQWFDRTRSPKPELWARPHLFPGAKVIGKYRQAILREKFRLFLTLPGHPTDLRLPVKKYENDAFLLRDGHHRAAYLMSKGAFSARLSVEPDILEKWKERERRFEAFREQYLEFAHTVENRAEPLETTLKNGGTFSARHYDLTAKLLLPIGREDEKILHVGSGTGFTSRQLARMGKQATAWEHRGDYRQWASKISGACGLDDIRYVADLHEAARYGPFDVILDTRLADSSTRNRSGADQELAELAKDSKKVIVLESEGLRITWPRQHFGHAVHISIPFDSKYRVLSYCADSATSNVGEYDFEFFGSDEKKLLRRRRDYNPGWFAQNVQPGVEKIE